MRLSHPHISKVCVWVYEPISICVFSSLLYNARLLIKEQFKTFQITQRDLTSGKLIAFKASLDSRPADAGRGQCVKEIKKSQARREKGCLYVRVCECCVCVCA